MDFLTAPRGLVVDLVTPLKENGEIDGPGLGRHLGRVLPQSHAVLIASPYAGEGINLSPTQREDLLDKTLPVVRGQVPLLVWVSRETEDGTIETLRVLQKGVNARKYIGPVFWVDTPLYYHSNRGLPIHYRTLCTMARRSWVLHNDPELIRQLGRSFKRNNIRTAVLKDLAGIEEIQGLIFLGPLEKAGHYQKAVRKRPQFRVYDGDESHFLMYPSMSGAVSRGANLTPRAWRKIVDASLHMADGQEDFPDRLQQIWETGTCLQNLLDIYRAFPAPIIKGALSEMGIIESPQCAAKSVDVARKVGAVLETMKGLGDREA
jgi:dihydrodipicolinate synthase/N-acetylneuraminate lyase